MWRNIEIDKTEIMIKSCAKYRSADTNGTGLPTQENHMWEMETEHGGDGHKAPKIEL